MIETIFLACAHEGGILPFTAAITEDHLRWAHLDMEYSVGDILLTGIVKREDGDIIVTINRVTGEWTQEIEAYEAEYTGICEKREPLF